MNTSSWIFFLIGIGLLIWYVVVCVRLAMDLYNDDDMGVPLAIAIGVDAVLYATSMTYMRGITMPFWLGVCILVIPIILLGGIALSLGGHMPGSDNDAN